MTDEEARIRSQIEKYLLGSQPIHWVNWISKCTDARAKEKLQSVLFEKGSLRDLTNPKIADEVLNAIYHTPSVMELVIADLRAEVQHVQKERE